MPLLPRAHRVRAIIATGPRRDVPRPARSHDHGPAARPDSVGRSTPRLRFVDDRPPSHRALDSRRRAPDRLLHICRATSFESHAPEEHRRSGRLCGQFRPHDPGGSLGWDPGEFRLLCIALGQLCRSRARGVWYDRQSDRLGLVPRHPACCDDSRGRRHVHANEGGRGGHWVTGIVDAVGVSKWYGEVLGLNAFTASFGRGITGLVGPNGAGKSTLFKLLIGQLHADQGGVRLLGENPWNNVALMRRLGYCPEHNQMYGWLTGQQFVETLLRLDGMASADARKAATEALKVVGLSAAAQRLTRTYSRGMRQRTKLAQALAHKPEVLILDEPLSGADPMARVN